MFTCLTKLREKCICSRDHWESLPVVFHSLIRMLDLDLSNVSVSPTGDDENWMKHTLSWLDKPHVEDAKVRSPKTKSSQLSWIGGNYFFYLLTYCTFLVFPGPQKSAEGDCFGYIGISTDFNGWRLDQCCLQILALDSHIISTNGLETAPKKLIFYPILCGILKSQDLKPLQWRWCSSTGGSLISPSIRCRNGQVGEWYGGWKLAKIESDWRCM